MIPANPYKIPEHWVDGFTKRFMWQEGFDVLKTWLLEACTEHPKLAAPVIETHYKLSPIDKHGRRYFLHHYLCPVCMQELKEAQHE